MNFVFIDEFGCNLSLRRGRGRSKVGTAATINTPGSRGHNLSVCAAIDINGPIHWFYKYQAFNQDHFITFLTELKAKLDPAKRNFLVMDNVAFHKTNTIRDFLRENHLDIIYLPPWSPMLNPIEECFSKVKGIIRQKRSSSGPDLMESINIAFRSVTASDCSGWFRHSKKFFSQCFNEQPIGVEPEPDLDGDFDMFESESDSEDEIAALCEM